MTDYDLPQEFNDEIPILDTPQFSRSDTRDVTGLTDVQLTNTLNRDLVQLSSEHNPGTGRRRQFSGSDILKLVVVFIMSAIGFPMRFNHHVADYIVARARNRLAGLDSSDDGLRIVTYPKDDADDWGVQFIRAGEQPDRPLPIAYQVVEVDRLIDDVLLKLRALVDDQPVPNTDVPDIIPAQDPAWRKDELGRDCLIGLTFAETRELAYLRALWLEDHLQTPGEDGSTKILISREQEARHAELGKKHRLAMVTNRK